MPGVTTTVSKPSAPTPLRQSGSLDVFEQKIVNPAIGLEFPNIDLVEVMDAPNSDEMLRDLGILSMLALCFPYSPTTRVCAEMGLVAERGVVMFRNQTRLNSSKHRDFIDRVSFLTGRPKENGIMKHALHQLYGDDAEVASLTPERLMMRYGMGGTTGKRQNHSLEWHRDMAFEKDPAALSSLRLEQLPLAGGGMYRALFAPYV